MIASLPPALFTRLLASPAKRCPRCGTGAFRVTPAGALACSECSPGDAVATLIAEHDGQRLRWRQWSADFDGTSPAGAAAGLGVAGDRVGAAVARDSIRGGWGPWQSPPAAFEDRLGYRVDPNPKSPAERILCVSTSLDWGWFAAGDLPAADVVCWRFGNLDNGGGLFMRLSQPVFAWLVQRVESLWRSSCRTDSCGRPVGVADLQSIAVAAMDGGVFGEWAFDETCWPRVSPVGFVPPSVVDAPVWWLCHEIGEWPWQPWLQRDAAGYPIKN